MARGTYMVGSTVGEFLNDGSGSLFGPKSVMEYSGVALAGAAIATPAMRVRGTRKRFDLRVTRGIMVTHSLRIASASPSSGPAVR
jgi:hypothetical protein